MNRSFKRVVVTGIGLVTPFGISREINWQAIVSGQQAIRKLACGECLHADASRPNAWPDLNIGAPRPAEANRPGQFDPVITLAEIAAAEALEDAEFNTPDWRVHQLKPERIGCVIGTSKGGLHAYSQLMQAFLQAGNIDTLNEALWSASWPNAAARKIASMYEISGPVLCSVAACATGLLSIIRGVELIQTGQCDLVLAGSTDVSLHTGILASFHRLGVLSRKFVSPTVACRPFDRNRSGFAVGEGAAVLVLESKTHADKRRVTSYGEWVGSGMACDATGLTDLDTHAQSLSRLLHWVLDRNDLSPGDIDYLNLHGTATVQNDLIEATAINSVFGEYTAELSCSSLKGAIGHLLGAAGSVELAIALLAMRDGIIPPTVNFQEPDPLCPLNVTPNEARRKKIQQIMKLSLGFGGHLATAIIRKSDQPRDIVRAH